jgi:hypothetical protein
MTPIKPLIDGNPGRTAKLSVTYPVELDPAAACRRLRTRTWPGTAVESPRPDRERYVGTRRSFTPPRDRASWPSCRGVTLSGR